MWDLSSQTSDQTHTPCIGRQSLNYHREVHVFSCLEEEFFTSDWRLHACGQPFNNAFYCRRLESLGRFIRELGVISLSFSVSLIRFPRNETYKQLLTHGVAGGGGGRVNTTRKLWQKAQNVPTEFMEVKEPLFLSFLTMRFCQHKVCPLSLMTLLSTACNSGKMLNRCLLNNWRPEG